jgi:hypothetical protein
MTPNVRNGNEIAELRAELAAVCERLSAVESILLGLYGPGALGGSKPPPGEPPPAPPRMKPIATLGPSFWGGPR